MKLLSWGACLAIVTAPAFADPYIGLDGTLGQIDWKSTTLVDRPSDTYGVGLHIGDRFSEIFGAELHVNSAYGQQVIANPSSGVRSISNRITVRDAALDGFAYMPLGPTGWFQPFLTAGIAYSAFNGRTATANIVNSNGGTSSTKTTYVPFLVRQQVNWRAGFGMELRASDDLSLRFAVRYQPYSFGKQLSGGTTFDISLETAL